MLNVSPYLLLFIYLLIINIYGFALMGIDKKRAAKGKWRIRERTLFLTAALLGAPGIWFGMQKFRHKTKHLSFCIGIPAIFVAQILIAAWLIYRFIL